MRTLVAVNTLTQVHSLSYASHCQEWWRMAKHFPDDEFILFNPHRSSIDRTRNAAVMMALEVQCDYLYFIDDDMCLSPATYKSLREADKDIVMALTVIRGYPYNVMHFIDPTDKYVIEEKETTQLEYFNDYENHIYPNGLLRVDAVGCATVLFKMKVFKDIEPPWFVTLANMTEDVYFCLKAQRRYGRLGISIYVDTKVPTGHIMEPEVCSIYNKKELKKRDEEDNPHLRVKPEVDRGEIYAQQAEEAIKNVPNT